MSIYNKIHKTISVILHKADYINKATYYPESNLKSKSQILKDFLWYIWKYGEIDPFYFTYGFDRAK